jgi:cytochrome c-type biogenesis protein CcmH/NrfG
MTSAADLAFRQALALCSYSPEAVFRYVSLLLHGNRIEDAVTVVRTARELDPTNPQVTDLLNRLLDMRRDRTKVGDQAQGPAELEAQAKDSPTNLQTAVRLAAACLQDHQTNRAILLLDGVLDSPNLDSTTVLAVCQAYAQMPNLPKLGAALEKLVQVSPESPEAWYDLAALRASLNKPKQATEALGRALDLGAARLRRDPGARDLAAEARKDARFNGIRHDPDFEKLFNPK